MWGGGEGGFVATLLGRDHLQRGPRVPTPEGLFITCSSPRDARALCPWTIPTVPRAAIPILIHGLHTAVMLQHTGVHDWPVRQLVMVSASHF